MTQCWLLKWRVTWGVILGWKSPAVWTCSWVKIARFTRHKHSTYIRHQGCPVLEQHLSDQKKKKEQASREELNHMFQNKEQSSQQTKYSKCCKGFTPLLVEGQNDCIIVLRISDGPAGWIGIIAVPGSWRQTQLPTCSKVGSRSWGVSMITHYNLRILPHSVIKRTVSVLRERGLLWHEFLQKAPGIKFADGNNSASVRLFFKSVVAAIKLCKDAFGRS